MEAIQCSKVSLEEGKIIHMTYILVYVLYKLGSICQNCQTTFARQI